MDLDFIHLTLPLVSSIFVSIIITFFLFFYGRTKFQPDYNKAVPVIEVIRTLEKICPINCSNKWKLFPSEHGCQRSWFQSLPLPILKKDVELYGSTITLNTSPMNVCSLIADVTKWPEWNPHHNSQYIIKSFHDKQLRKDFFMEADQIFSIVREDIKIPSHLFMYRFRDFSENKVGWILFWNPKKLDFSYFLIQPVKDKNDNPLCLLTHIMGNDSKFLSSSVSLVSQRLRNITDLVMFSSLSIPSVVPPKSEDATAQKKSQTSDSNSKSQPSASNNQENYYSLSSVRARKRDVRNTLFVLVPFVSPLHAFSKGDIEFKLAVRSKDDDKNFLNNPKESSKVGSLVKLPLRRATSDMAIKSKISSENQDSCALDYVKGSPLPKTKSSSVENYKKALKHNSDTTSEDSESIKNSVSKGQMLSHSKFISYSETAVNNLGNCENSLQLVKGRKMYESNHKLEDISESTENKLLAMDEQSSKQIFNSSVSDYEVVENCEFTENRIAGFLTQGNYGAAELQAEAYLASLCADDMSSGNFQSNSGWTFHSYHKGMCVFTKTSCNKFLKICSFLCQAEIATAPKDVWRFVKNPQFRFICDESVKTVEVLEKISSSQKLIHTYHEIGGFIRKELMDFCLLQTEREEATKYYSCFCSVEFDKCPFMNSVTRGTMRPSGWIVEKIDSDANKSLVTYMMQVLINSPDSLFIQELSAMVPQSVYNLKNYVMSKPV